MTMEEGFFWRVVEQPGQFIARALALLGGLLIGLLGLGHILWPISFGQFVLGFPFLAIAFVVYVVEASPELAPYLLEVLSLLKRLDGRGLLYILFGCVSQGSTWSIGLGTAAGLSLETCGVLLILAKQARSQHFARTSALISAAAMRSNEDLIIRNESNPTLDREGINSPRSAVVFHDKDDGFNVPINTAGAYTEV